MEKSTYKSLITLGKFVNKIGMVKNFLCLTDYFLSYWCNDKPFVSALKELNFKHPFNFFYLPAQGGLGDVAAFCRPAKAFLLCNHNEILQVTQGYSMHQ
jgi:hypothetical protein